MTTQAPHHLSFSAPVLDDYLDLAIFEHDGVYRVEIERWAKGYEARIRDRIALAGLKLAEPPNKDAFFTVAAPDVWQALARIEEIFSAAFEFQLPVYWYLYPRVAGGELDVTVEELNSDHTHVIIWPGADTDLDGQDDKPQQAYIDALAGSGLCVPGTVFCQAGRFYLELTPEAAAAPLETFSALTRLHPSVA